MSRSSTCDGELCAIWRCEASRAPGLQSGYSVRVSPAAYRRHYPSAPLSSFVSCLWYWAGAPTTHSKERILPTGDASIIFNLRDEPIRVYEGQAAARFESYGQAVVSGARSTCFGIDAAQQECVVGVQFRAGGAFPFFRFPMSELEERSVNLADVWGASAAEIRERLLAARDPQKALLALEECLYRQLVAPLQMHPAVQFALKRFQKSGQDARIAALADEIGLSSRRFSDVFRREVGLPPKAFLRVSRFQQAIQTAHGKRELDWAQLALACGYYDQAHFIHDFREFSGLTPSAYLALATPHLNHVPLD
jgi:AraC-like DNA-binding protein